jgi:hypothetical protein
VEEGEKNSVKSCYKMLKSLLVWEENWSGDEKRVFECIWKSLTSLKVVVFS